MKKYSSSSYIQKDIQLLLRAFKHAISVADAEPDPRLKKFKYYLRFCAKNFLLAKLF
jgi:hypothetical protein